MRHDQLERARKLLDQFKAAVALRGRPINGANVLFKNLDTGGSIPFLIAPDAVEAIARRAVEARIAEIRRQAAQISLQLPTDEELAK